MTAPRSAVAFFLMGVFRAIGLPRPLNAQRDISCKRGEDPCSRRTPSLTKTSHVRYRQTLFLRFVHHRVEVFDLTQPQINRCRRCQRGVDLSKDSCNLTLCTSVQFREILAVRGRDVLSVNPKTLGNVT